MPVTPIAGTSGRVSLAGSPLYLNKWEVVETAGEIENTNFLCVGSDDYTYRTYLPGLRVAEVSFSGFFNEGTTLGSLGIYAGANLPNVYCYLDKGSTTLYYGFTNLLVTGLTVSAGVHDKEVKVSIKGKSSGQYTYPS